MKSVIKPTNKCIYCGTFQHLCRSSHIVSRCLGTFENQPTLSCKVCQQCESEIGKCEEVLVRCGPEALFKTYLGIKGRHKEFFSPFRRKYAGHGPSVMKIKYPGTNHEMLVEPVGDGENCQIIPHIEIRDVNGNKEQIVIEDTSSLTAQKLKELIFSTSIKCPTQVWPRMSCNEQVDKIFGLLDECGLLGSEETVEGIKPFIGAVETNGQLFWDGRRFRAIAKIAFHYYVKYNGFEHEGSEDLFMAIREFIRHGKGELDDFVMEKEGYFVEQLKRGWKPPTYGHIIAAIVNTKFIKVKIQMFVGPDYEPPYYEIMLCKNPFRREVSEEIFGHNYVYYRKDEKQNYQGTMHQLRCI